MPSLHLKVITPKKVVLEEEVASVTVPSSEGEITILPRHVRLLSLLKEGVITIRKKNDEDYLAIGGGYLETDGKDLSILVSRAYGQNEIDEKLTEKAMSDAKQILKESKDHDSRAEAAAILRRSVVELKLLKRKRRPAA